MNNCDKCTDDSICKGKRDGSCEQKKEHGNTSEGVCNRRKIRKNQSGGMSKISDGGSFVKN